MEIRPIVTEDDHRDALREIERLWEAPAGSPEDARLDALVTLVDAYEARRWPAAPGDPVTTIEAHMRWNDYTQADLAQLLGSRSRASEVLRRKRALTVEMIRRLHAHWGIPAELLIRPYALSAA